ncbi:GTPase [Georgenia sp. Z1491]|uniref:GTPase n=1 Tax=Georgenia sp. Z1491 TaxID=3416707 RepID=UPI003CF0722E
MSARRRGRRARDTGDLATDLTHLRTAVEAARGHLPADVLDRADVVLTRAGERGSLAPGTTVAALLGATGSGKSSLVNALAGAPVARVAPTRPTTQRPHAVTFAPGPDGSAATAELLDWLDVPERTPAGGHDERTAGLVVLDLPDIDSTAAAHRELATQLAERVDVLVWVLDPQKYADAVVHREFLAPMARHADVTLVVLNHADTLSGGARDAVVDDLRRLLADDGLGGVPVLLTSARTGEGVAELAGAVADQAASQVAAHARLRADAATVAEELAVAAELDAAEPGRSPAADERQVVAAASGAAGVPVVTRAAAAAYRRRAGRHVGWPPVRWVSRLRPDPLRRLHLGERGGAGRVTSLPPAGPAQVASLTTAVRRHVEARAGGMPDAWRADVGADVEGRVPGLLEQVDPEIGAVDLGQGRRPAWWRVLGLIQWVLIGAAVAGGVWLGGLAVMGYLRMPAPATPDWRGWPVPTLLLLGGVLAGLLVWVLGSWLARIGARRRAGAVRRRLRSVIAERVRADVTEPLDAHLARFEEFSSAVRALR